MRLLFAILSGRAPSLLELADRPAAYDDVGRLCRWGSVIHELKNFEAEIKQEHRSIDEYVVERAKARHVHLTELETVAATHMKVSIPPPPVRRPTMRTSVRTSVRRNGGRAKLLPAQYLDRRGTSLLPGDGSTGERRRARERRKYNYNVPFPDRRLTRSAYEQVFLKLVSGGKLRVGDELYSPVGMKGWYHAIFRRESDGSERLMTIDQLLQKMNDWQ
jgi:hypothetical protein